jgi:Flp pilus assembly protein TadD
VLSLAGCSKKSAKVERVAILPANLLISDPSFEWLKVGVPLVLQHDLSTAHGLLSGFAPDEAGAIQGGATRILRTSLENQQGGIHIECTLVDAATHKVVQVEKADASSSSVLLPALNQVAKKIAPEAIDFSTRNQQAWQAFVTAEGNNDPQQRAQFLNQAISQDQNFGYAWVSLIEMIAPGRQSDMKSVIDQAKSHVTSFDPYDRARFDLAMDRLTNPGPAVEIKHAQAILQLAPNDLNAMSTLGSYQILAGESAAGEQSLRHAVSLNPSNFGLRFQLGRGLMQLRKFKDAQTIFTAIEKNPTVYPELATCALLQGDRASSAAFSEKFIGSVQNDELKSLLRAVWSVMSGDRQKGIDLALNSKFSTPRIQSLALTDAVIWQVMGGDFANAQKTVGLITQVAGQSQTLPQVAGLLADKSTPPADWQNKVQQVSLPDAVKQPILAYGFFVRGNYDDAVKAWQQVDNQTHGEDLRARAMLASSLDRAGRKAEAQRIVVIPFTPELADLYAAISFTEMRRMIVK